MIPVYYSATERLPGEYRIRRYDVINDVFCDFSHSHNCEIWRPDTHRCYLSQQWIEYVPNGKEMDK